MKIQHLPWLKFLLPFLLGIVLVRFIDIKIPYWLISTVAIIYFLLNTFYKKYDKRWLYLFSFLCLTLFGIAYTQLFQLKHQMNHFSKYEGEYALAYISQPIETKEKSIQVILNIDKIIHENKSQNANGTLLLYIQKDSLPQKLEVGDELLIPLKYNEIDAPKNLNQFNYKQYLSYKNIYHQAYIKKFEYKIVAKKQKYFIQRKSDEISKYVQSLLRKFIPDKENFNLADGIFLGHKSEMDIEQYNTFAYLGIVHILSVSGLHVGIIYLLISYFLSFIPNKNKSIFLIKFLVAFFLIWLFAFVVGLSPAVVRSALLFSILHIGRILKEDTLPLNILIGAAFVQLLINPLVIYNVGFQLSYLAMLGLYLFYKPIYNVLYSKNKYVDWFSQLCSASIAAQIFTLPFAIYYFGNFPTYFLLANIFAIPLSTLILWFCIALIPFQFIPILAKYTGILISFLVDAFIYLSNKLLLLPYSKINTLYINKFQLLLCCIAIFLFTVYIINKKIKFAIYSLIVVLITVLSAYFYQYQNYKHDKLAFYSVNNNLVFAHHQKEQALIYSKNKLLPKDFAFNLSNACRYFSNKFIKYQILQQDFQVINNKTIFRLNQNTIQKVFDQKLEVDFLILEDNIYLDIQRLQQNYNFKHLLLSADLDYKHRNIYSKLLTIAAIPFIDLKKTAYIVYSL